MGTKAVESYLFVNFEMGADTSVVMSGNMKHLMPDIMVAFNRSLVHWYIQRLLNANAVIPG
jgi:hypothetical protein